MSIYYLHLIHLLHRLGHLNKYVMVSGEGWNGKGRVKMKAPIALNPRQRNSPKYPVSSSVPFDPSMICLLSTPTIKLLIMSLEGVNP